MRQRAGSEHFEKRKPRHGGTDTEASFMSDTPVLNIALSEILAVVEYQLTGFSGFQKRSPGTEVRAVPGLWRTSGWFPRPPHLLRRGSKGNRVAG